MVAVLALLVGGKSLNYDSIASITGERTASAYQHRFRTVLKHAKLVNEDRAKGGKAPLADLIPAGGKLRRSLGRSQANSISTAKGPRVDSAEEEVKSDYKLRSKGKKRGGAASSEQDKPTTPPKKKVKTEPEIDTEGIGMGGGFVEEHDNDDFIKDFENGQKKNPHPYSTPFAQTGFENDILDFP